MDSRKEIREYLASRRARLTPQQAGLPNYGGSRRVPGLRRDEVALLAGISVEYYTRLERGHLSGASEAVLESLARALQLDEAERAHLFDLARSANATVISRRPAPPGVRPSVQRILDAMRGVPAWVRNDRLDFLAANRLAYALYSEMLADPVRPANNARFVFLNPRSREFYVDWERVANDIVAILHSEAGRNPYDRDLTDLIGELSTRSDLFRSRWAAHNVRFHRTGRKQLRHPVVGELDLTYEAMELPGEPKLTVLVYTAEPVSETQQALDRLASLAATLDKAALDEQSDAVAPTLTPTTT